MILLIILKVSHLLQIFYDITCVPYPWCGRRGFKRVNEDIAEISGITKKGYVLGSKKDALLLRVKEKFLEIITDVLETDPKTFFLLQYPPESSKNQFSTCSVFAESEVILLIMSSTQGWI
jgi:hypothetical protein